MYRNLESYSVVKKILLESVPNVEALKMREEGENLIVTGNKHELLFFNEVAKDFLLLCDGRRRFAEIVDALAEIYDAEKNLLTDDLIDTIQALQYKRILYMEAA